MDCPYCDEATLENHSKEELVSCFRRYLEDSTPTGEPSQRQMDEYMRGLGYQPQRAETFDVEENYDMMIKCINCLGEKKMRHISPVFDPYDPFPQYHKPMYYCLHCGGREGKMTTAQIQYEMKDMKELNPNWKEVFPIEKYHAETFDVEFDEWADQEMLTHGQDISFRDWAKDEGKKHGNVPITDWAEHEEESHDERYGAETFGAGERKCGACGETGHNARTCKSKSVPFSTGGFWNEKTFDGLEQLGLPFVDASHVAMISKVIDGEILKEPNARVRIPNITWKEEPITMTWGELTKNCKNGMLVSIGESTYDCTTLLKSFAYLPKNTVLTLYTGYHYPLKATFEYGGEEWIFFLAPRIKDHYAETFGADYADGGWGYVVQKTTSKTKFNPARRSRTGKFKTKEEAEKYRQILREQGHGKFASLRVVNANKNDAPMETFGKNAKGEYFRHFQSESKKTKYGMIAAGVITAFALLPEIKKRF